MCKKAHSRLLALWYNAMVSYVLSAPLLSAHSDVMSYAYSIALQHVEPRLDNEPGSHYESYGSSFD
jgi:hypothetical protein